MYVAQLHIRTSSFKSKFFNFLKFKNTVIAISEMVNCLALYFLRQQMNYETIL